MKFWRGVSASLLFHAALFCIPYAAGMTRVPPCEELQLVIMPGEDLQEMLSSRESAGPPSPGEGSSASLPQATPPFEATPVSDLPEPPLREEKAEEVLPVEPLPHEPVKDPVPAMPAVKPPKPSRPKPVKSPPKPAVKPPRCARPVETPPPSPFHGQTPPVVPVVEGKSPGGGNPADPGEEQNKGGLHHGGGCPPNAGPMEAPFGSGNGPAFVSKAIPKYPRLAREKEKEGTVLLRLTIDEFGRLVDVEVVKKAGSGFDEEAVRAVRNSRFSPARKDGKPLTCKALLPIRFVLTSHEDD